MTPREILLKMLDWIKAQQEKAKKPGGEPFIFTSLGFCATESGAGEMRAEVLALLHGTAKNEGGDITYDAVRPFRAIFLIKRTLASLA